MIYHHEINIFASCERNFMLNKKVLRERKRHTACRAVTTPSVVLTGYPPSWPGWGVPYLSTPPAGYPLAGYLPSWPGQGGTLPEYPPSRVPPGRVPPVSGPWHSGKCCKALWDVGTPLWTDRLMEGQTHVKTLPSRRTTYVGGKNQI